MNNNEYIAKQLVDVYLQINQFFFVDCDWVEKNIPNACMPIVNLANNLYEKIVGEMETFTSDKENIDSVIIPFEVIVRMTKDIIVINWFEEQKEKELENEFY